MAGDIQDDVFEIMYDASNPATPTAGLNLFVVSTIGMSNDQLKSVSSMLQESWTCGHTSAYDDFNQNGKSSYIHDDIKLIMDKSSTSSMSADYIKSIDIMLQYAWNRGYKSACKDIYDDE